jgi:GWxTD domain-containing protein
MLQSWLDAPAAKALGLTLLHSLWEGALIAALLGLALCAFRSSRVRYAAACLSIVALLAAFVLTFIRFMPESGKLAKLPPLATLRAPAYEDASPTPNPQPPTPFSAFLAPLWIAGVVAFQFRTAAAWHAARGFRRRGVCAPPEIWQQRLDELARLIRLSRPVTILESSIADVPAVIGWLRPVILMPVGLLAGLPAGQVEAILLHELAHIRRSDYLVNVLQFAVEGLLFYHPAAWWISGVIRAEREHCCDDLVVATRGEAHEYAVALAALEENRWTARQAVLAATGGSLVKRIRRILLQPERPRTSLAPVFSAIILTVAAAATVAAWQTKAPAQPDKVLYDSAANDLQHHRYEKARLTLQTLINTYTTSEYLLQAKLAIADTWYRQGGTRALAQAVAEYKDFILFYPMTAEAADAQKKVCRIEHQSDCPPLIAQARPAAPAPTPQTPQSELQTRRRSEPQTTPSTLDGPYRNWLNEDVAYIITDEERKAFKTLPTDAEREHFIEQFWTRRDPTPGTVENEMKEEHYRRIAYTNDHFASFVPGWKTDRGRVYIVYGPPDEIESHPNGSATQSFPYEQWLYRHIDGVGSNVIVEFDDPNRTGEYRMTMDPNAETFTSVEPGEKVRVTVPSDRRAQVVVPLLSDPGKYSVSGRITHLETGILAADFTKAAVGAPSIGWGAAEPLTPGQYLLTATVKNNTTGVSLTYTVSFNVK